MMATRWGIVSAGRISHDFVTAVRSMPGNEHKFVAVAARNKSSAKEFASLHKIPRAYGSYEELSNDPDVEVVYTGTINNHHFSVGKLMLESGKHVLMEKPMTLNLKQTKELIATARKQKRFLMEGIWSRFLPSYGHLVNQLQKTVIGEVVHVSSSLGKRFIGDERVESKSVGGGSILTLGIYTLNIASLVYNGEKPKKIVAVGHLNNDGIDTSVAASLLYSKNRTAQMACNTMNGLPCDAIITGTKGQIRIPEFMCAPTNIEINNKSMEFPLPDTVLPCNYKNSSGLRYEAMEVRKCIQKGILESPVMPLKDSELLAETMDEIRRQIGVVYDED